MTSDIKVTYINSTTDTDFAVVVFTKNFNLETPVVYYVAWRVLRVDSLTVDFVYPVTMDVGATYAYSGQTMHAGPFPAKLGSTWEITQESISDTAILKESK